MVRNYGKMLVELSTVVPDGIVCFFVSYLYMDQIVTAWHEMGILQEVGARRLLARGGGPLLKQMREERQVSMSGCLIVLRPWCTATGRERKREGQSLCASPQELS